jgi:hypothetical protein
VLQNDTLRAECGEHVEEGVLEWRTVELLGSASTKPPAKLMAGFHQDGDYEDDYQNTEPETGVEGCQEISPLHVYHFGLPNEQPIAGKKTLHFYSICLFYIICFSFAFVILGTLSRKNKPQGITSNIRGCQKVCR